MPLDPSLSVGGNERQEREGRVESAPTSEHQHSDADSCLKAIAHQLSGKILFFYSINNSYFFNYPPNTNLIDVHCITLQIKDYYVSL